jgi:hypothetical protein
MKTKCQFTSYKSTIKVSYSEPLKKNKGKKESQERTSHQNKERNAHTTTQLSEKNSFLTHQR